MDARQDTLVNPLGLDEACTNCPELAEIRERIVHGYGDVGADLLVVGEAPTAAAERTGVPFTGDERGRAVQSLLVDLGVSESPPDADAPAVGNAYLTYLARCRHPDRPPSDAEIRACDPYLTAEIRMINPELLVPVGKRPLRALAAEYTTSDPDALDPAAVHAEPIRGRGFELVPLRDPGAWEPGDRETFVETMRELLGGDYRQAKGRRGRETRERSPE